MQVILPLSPGICLSCSCQNLIYCQIAGLTSFNTNRQEFVICHLYTKSIKVICIAWWGITSRGSLFSSVAFYAISVFSLWHLKYINYLHTCYWCLTFLCTLCACRTPSPLKIAFLLWKYPYMKSDFLVTHASLFSSHTKKKKSWTLKQNRFQHAKNALNVK